MFASADEVQLAYAQGKVGTHAAITRAAARRAASVKGDRGVKPGGMVQTTVGRVLFNAMLPEGMPYYNTPLRSSDLAGVISDCYEILGRRNDDRPVGRHEPARLPPEHAERPVLRHRRPDHAAEQGEDHRQRREGGDARS